tara:strand:- start:55 stop:459 length:405 start_codon:yes stop_codon:yes gene_type:complete
LTFKDQFINFPKNFNEEKKVLISLGIDSWGGINNLEDNEIFAIVRSTIATERNLKRLRCIAMFICELKIPLKYAAILMHSGVPSIRALASLTPNELYAKTGRLERILNTRRKPILDLEKANYLIKKARNRQLNN